MRTLLRTLTVASTVVASALVHQLVACTNILVTKGASKDGSTMVAYSADSHTLYGALYYKAGGRHLPGVQRDVVEWDTGKFLGRIPEAPVTYTRVGNMNEHQLVIGESTYGGRKELAGSGLLDYGSLIYMGLERAKTAREAIQVITGLIEQHGYASSGESFSIADKNEVWMLEMIGKGKGDKGAVWVALRIPDGTIAAHANQARIRQFPLNDPQNCLYSKDVISFARAKGWFKGEDKAFSFADTYAPLTFGALRGCEARVWSIFNRAAKGAGVSMDFVKAVPGAKPMPLCVKPDQKLDPRDVMELMRDHYEGTEFDMTQDVGAGPYKAPYRWRPMGFKVEGQDYVHERAVSTQQTGWSYVSQSRAWMPDAVGGVLWFGVDDTYTTCYFPVYCSTKAVPRHWGEDSGSMLAFSWDSAFWVTNFVSNYAYSRWSDMIQDVQKVQRELEAKFLSEQAEVDAQALKLHQQSPGAARDFLTQYSSGQGELVYTRYKQLGEFLVWKYLDGNVRRERNELQQPEHPAYPADWYKRIANERGAILKVKKVPGLAADED